MRKARRGRSEKYDVKRMQEWKDGYVKLLSVKADCAAKVADVRREV